MGLKESDHQKAVCQYLDLRRILYFAPVNENIWSGIIRFFVKPKAMADKIIYSIINKMKVLGYKKGVLDLFIMEPRKGFHGLIIEMKSTTGKPTPEQIKWIKELTKNNYYVAVCHSANEAIKVINKYME